MIRTVTYGAEIPCFSYMRMRVWAEYPGKYEGDVEGKEQKMRMLRCFSLYRKRRGRAVCSEFGTCSAVCVRNTVDGGQKKCRPDTRPA